MRCSWKRGKKFLVVIATLEVMGIFFVFSSFAEDKMNSTTTSSKICFQIDKIVIYDQGLLPKKEISNLQSDYEGRCLNAVHINEIQRILTNKFVKYGYVTTRPIIPRQNLKSGKLVINILEGKIEKTEYKRGRRIGQDHVLPISQDKILNLRDIEQSSDQFSSLAEGGKSKIIIKPGKEQNTSIVEIDDEKTKAWRFSSSIDNYGTKNKGIEQSSTSIAVENLLKSNDQYYISHRLSLGDPRRRFTRTYSGGISIPYDYYNVGFNISHSTYRTFINANREKFRNAGNSKTYKIDLSRNIHRDGKSKSSANIGYSHDNFSNYIADTRIEISSYRLDKLDIGLNHQRRLAKSVIGAGVTYTYGINCNYLKSLGSGLKPHSKFHKINYNLMWLKSFSMKPEYFAPKFTSTIAGQFTSQRLVGSEKISIGGMSSVRGYKELIENADNGIYWRNELALGFVSKDKIKNPFFENTELFIGLDLGRFANYEAKKEVSGMMSGAAIGIRNNKGIVRFEASIGKGIQSKYIKPKDTEFYFSIGVAV